MKFKNVYFVFFITLFFACEHNKELVVDSDNLLLGNWVLPVYDEGKTTFTRNNSLPDQGYGITFKQNGSLVERTSGFCGTPPLSFFNVEGSFTLEDNLISIATQGFPSFYAWRILELTENKLVVKRELSEQEKDHRALMDLFEEISNMAYSTPCTDSSDWSFVAFGAKACGGPQGYLPYNNSIDVANFLEKVEAYTNAEKEFNVKWSIVSDCAVVSPPKSIDCQYETPVLIY